MPQILSLVAALTLSAVIEPTNAAVYRWTDASGTAYFTNNESDIPLRYRAKAKVLYQEQGELNSSQRTAPQLATPSVQQIAPESPKPPQVAAPPQQPNQPPPYRKRAGRPSEEVSE